jgi:hypothetical protein
MLRVDLLWTHPDPRAADPGGRSFEDFFRDGGAWRMRTYDVPDQAITAARAEYRGPDDKGYGVAVRVWDGYRWIAMALDPSCTVLRDRA